MILRQRKHNRLKNFNYSKSGWYFLTICTKNRVEYFGNIVNRKMILNELGKIADRYWLEIPKHFNNAELDEHILMPNHIHGIIIIRNIQQIKNKSTEIQMVGNRHACSLQQDEIVKRNNQTLFNVIGSFKSATSNQIHVIGLNSFRWQKSFYDHIIRDEKSLFVIRKYIRNNPKNWENDRNNLENLYM